jgi:hypothetical protein
MIDDDDRERYVEGCKERARELLAEGDVQSAIASMISDMNKREDCKVAEVLVVLGVLIATRMDEFEAQRFVEGFR